MTDKKIKIAPIIKPLFLMLLLAVCAGLGSCNKTQSYSELLREEEKAVNWYLAQNKVELQIPSDSISFLVGKDAPFYKLDEDGNVYMQVINRGDLNADGRPSEKIEKGDQVYFRYTRQNIRSMYEYGIDSEYGNSNNLLSGDGSSYFLYKNTNLNVSTQWGTGIQMPMRFFGYNSEVNLVIKSYCGFASDQTYCYPYVINVRYFKPEY